MLFVPALLVQFSWTGISRTSGLTKKRAFQENKGIIALFNKVILLADSRWSISKTENYFKNTILKHATQKNIAIEKKIKRKQDGTPIALCENSTDDQNEDDEAANADQSLPFLPS